MTSLSTDAEDLTAGAQCGPELDVGDSVTATLALACFAAVSRIAPDADREPPRLRAHGHRTGVRDRGTVSAAAAASGRSGRGDDPACCRRAASPPSRALRCCPSREPSAGAFRGRRWACRWCSRTMLSSAAIDVLASRVPRDRRVDLLTLRADTVRCAARHGASHGRNVRPGDTVSRSQCTRSSPASPVTRRRRRRGSCSSPT